MLIYRQGKTTYSEKDMDLTDDELAGLRMKPIQRQARCVISTRLTTQRDATEMGSPDTSPGGDRPEWL